MISNDYLEYRGVFESFEALAHEPGSKGDRLMKKKRVLVQVPAYFSCENFAPRCSGKQAGLGECILCIWCTGHRVVSVLVVAGLRHSSVPSHNL
jgi:hypothetical protein